MRIRNSFILFDGVGQKTERSLWNKGITDWDAAKSQSALPGKADIEKAEKNLEVSNSKYFSHKLPSTETWRLYDDFKSNACYFDIETTGLSPKKNKITTAAFHNSSSGSSKVYTRDEDLRASAIKQEIESSDLIVTYNGKSFDVPFIEKSLGIEVNTPHLDLMHAARKVGLTGGLKGIEKDLGIDRENDLDGKDAIRLWKRYENKGDKDSLTKLQKYNKKDAVNLRPLASKIKDRIHSQNTPDFL